MRKELKNFISYLKNTSIVKLMDDFDIKYRNYSQHNKHIANYYLYHVDMTGFQKDAKYVAYYENKGLYVKLGNYGYMPLGRTFQEKLYYLFEVHNINIRNRIINEQEESN